MVNMTVGDDDNLDVLRAHLLDHGSVHAVILQDSISVLLHSKFEKVGPVLIFNFCAAPSNLFSVSADKFNTDFSLGS